MNTKTLYATLISTIVYFFLGWGVFGLLLMDFYEANTIFYAGLNKEMPDMAILILSSLVWCFMLTFILQVLAEVKTWKRGFAIAAFLTFLYLLSLDLYMFSSMNLFNGTLLIVDVIVGALVSGIVGAVIGFVLGFGRKGVVQA